uniref:glutathione transferase n=1 Tax=Brachionus rotundiformis TaxID=96890 RepID=A0A3G2JSE6_9BILA|nr:glutathione S-transferase S11 [Brachionus rotundiformis]
MPNYKLHYFNGRGRAEISRLILAASGVNYEDVRVNDWPKTKSDAPVGQLPYIEIDGLKLPQSLSIARYLAREYNLVGKNNLDAAKADAIVDTCIDLMTGFYQKVFLVTDIAEKEVALKKFLSDDAIKGLENVEKLAKQFGSKGFSVGKSLTWADLFIHEITYSLMNYQDNLLDNFQVLKQIREAVESNENIAKYLKNRPVTPF